MRKDVKGKRLCIFIGEYDRVEHRSLADAILEHARDQGLAGGTVMRGIEGFGHAGRLKTARLLSSSDDLPIVVEIIDESPRIDAFVPVLEQLVGNALVTLEEVDITVFHDE